MLYLIGGSFVDRILTSLIKRSAFLNHILQIYIFKKIKEQLRDAISLSNDKKTIYIFETEENKRIILRCLKIKNTQRYILDQKLAFETEWQPILKGNGLKRVGREYLKNCQSVSHIRQRVRFNIYSQFFARLNGVESVVFACDHSAVALGALEAFGSLAKFLYIQHGFVVEHNFPPLWSDEAYLWDQRSLDIYKKINTNFDFDKKCAVNLVHIGFDTKKEDLNSSLEFYPDVFVICPNRLVSLSGVLSSLLVLGLKYPESGLKLRLHPQQKWAKKTILSAGHAVIASYSQFAKIVTRNKKLRYSKNSEAKREVYIVGNSSVVMELKNQQKTIFYDGRLDKCPFDYYGFLKDGLVSEFEY